MLQFILANIGDLDRIHWLTLQRKLPQSLYVYALESSLAYVVRIVELRLRYRRHWWQVWREKYPGPVMR